MTLLAHDGLRDRKHLSVSLKQHENSMEHKRNMNTWNELRQWEIAKEKVCWRQVLVGIVDAVKLCASYRNAGKDYVHKTQSDRILLRTLLKQELRAQGCPVKFYAKNNVPSWIK
jgi:hypothetical protein